MGLWLQTLLVLLCTVVLVSSVPTSIQKPDLEETDSQLIEDDGSHHRGSQFGNRLGSGKNDSSTGERRSHRRRRKHNRQCEQTGHCPEGLPWQRLYTRGHVRRTRCSADGDCPEGQMCKERRHGRGRKHQNGGTLLASGNSSPSSHSGPKVGKKFCRERKNGVHRRSGLP
ncbi:putative DNA double-strand break repair rad50 ATPase [Schistosoma mansoni]|uniref:putative DNA double-strand break repair rad50 ATPase n=1 Tax=Schistosoma mansoni TaxID=6183 RepID=UPI00022DC922|nr:putative DNA double-strand break repair rad50 ATPase [Schistosoma mansoni]|eukprot:XP_018647523.1 putative DNA double-strand break repair rad50 ATPase [Schistosoma mansoni]